MDQSLVLNFRVGEGGHDEINTRCPKIVLNRTKAIIFEERSHPQLFLGGVHVYFRYFWGEDEGFASVFLTPSLTSYLSVPRKYKRFYQNLS